MSINRPVCNCGNLCKPNGVNVNGSRKYNKLCSPCLRKRNKQGNVKGLSDRRKQNSILYKGGFCCECGFVPIHKCQLDLDHIDGNSFNNSPENHQTLCANCHRLKTHLCEDNKKQVQLLTH